MRVISLRPRRSNCAVCGDNPQITEPIDYVKFCGTGKNKSWGDASTRDERVTCQEIHQEDYQHLIDVRPAVEFGMCALKNSVNVPYNELVSGKADLEQVIPKDTTEPVYILCRAGINSQISVQYLKERYPNHCFKDIIGGLLGWTADVDPSFPNY